METQVNSTSTNSTRSVGIRFGLIGALISVAYFLILNVSGIDMTRGVWNWFGYALTLVLLIFAHQQFKERGDGFMSYGQGMGVAFWMGLVSAVLGSLFTYVYVKFIDEGFLELLKNKQIEALQEQGMSEQQIDQAIEVSSMFMTAEAILVMGLIGGIAVTLIIGLFVTIFTQKKNPEPVF